MKIAIIIPAYNEEAFINKTLDSLINQTKPFTTLIVVDDNSTDNTAQIVTDYSKLNQNIKLVKKKSSDKHLPGSKVVHAFNEGLTHLEQDFDILCKFDADLIFPSNYLEKISNLFQKNPTLGMAGGFCYILKNDKWVLENLTNKDHIRGALKSYRKACFKDIGGVKPAMGWDTIDELLAQYHHWQVVTDTTLHVKHLKPTGSTYSHSAKYKQGEAFYRMRYGFILTQIAAAKLAMRKRKVSFYFDYLKGYFKAKKEQKPYLVSHTEGTFIRKTRWKNILHKFLPRIYTIF